MKKVFLTCAVIAALVILSCKDKSTTSSDSETRTETSSKETTTETSSSENGVPSFGDADVQAYVESYESYLEDYKKAVESKDMAAFPNLATKGQDLATKAQEVSGKVSGADAEKLTAYMMKKAEELQELSKKMME
ncbi:hypothetical protein FEE95_17700 [Maribacter algarum]|uniref:Lipoprotein n=1 Tax=Maribacter algarum (ex Zhang et al. 2020) TaxID=2578118 RepID=A0A5S3Q9L3_9FLAO|nr:hypothetical protein [Maribacter algarum]TMM53733.1 hypothetical protein FEE95_17700 [Maribacter algarum]